MQVTAGAMVRDVMFVTRSGPGIVLPEALPAVARATSERLLFVGGRYRFASRFDLGLDLAFAQRAALFFPPAEVVLVEGPGKLTTLPSGVAPLPRLELRPSVGVRIARTIACVAWLQYGRDRNALGYARASASSGPEFSKSSRSPDFLGYGASMRASF
jgi:hypothetical protein